MPYLVDSAAPDRYFRSSAAERTRRHPLPSRSPLQPQSINLDSKGFPSYPIFDLSMGAFIYRKTQTLGKIQFIIGGRKQFTICRRNEYGIINLKKKCMIKQTSLYREFLLRIRARILTQEFYDLREKGLDDWDAYHEHKASIWASFLALGRAFKRYKDRRIKAGFFYMYAHPNLNVLYVMSPLYTLPRQEALKKIRRHLRNRRAYEQASTSYAAQGSNSSICIDAASWSPAAAARQERV